MIRTSPPGLRRLLDRLANQNAAKGLGGEPGSGFHPSALLRPLNRTPGARKHGPGDLGRFRAAMPLLILLLLLVGGFVSLEAQSGPRVPGPVVTDRPDKTESTSIVSPGYAQLEAGWSLEAVDAAGTALHTHNVPGLLVRVGVLDALEARVGFAGFELTNPAPPGVENGPGDMELGFKYRLAKAQGALPDLAVIAAASVPTGADGVTSGRVDPTILLTASRPISDRVSVGSNLGSSWTTVDDGLGGRTTLVDFTYTLSFGFSLSERVGAFAETFGSLPAEDGNTAHHVDGGLTVLVRDNLQLDLSVGRGVAGAGATDWFVGAGVALRLPR